MILKEVLEKYITICGHTGLSNRAKKCRCDLSNLMYCNLPMTTCEVIKKSENDD